MTDAAIAEHIIYLVNKHTEYLDAMDKQYTRALEVYRTQVMLHAFSDDSYELPTFPEKPTLAIEINSLLLNRITATLENRSIDELSNT